MPCRFSLHTPNNLSLIPRSFLVNQGRDLCHIVFFTHIKQESFFPSVKGTIPCCCIYTIYHHTVPILLESVLMGLMLNTCQYARARTRSHHKLALHTQTHRHTHTHAHAHTCTHTEKRARTHARTHARTPKNAHARTHFHRAPEKSLITALHLPSYRPKVEGRSTGRSHLVRNSQFPFSRPVTRCLNAALVDLHRVFKTGRFTPVWSP